MIRDRGAVQGSADAGRFDWFSARGVTMSAHRESDREYSGVVEGITGVVLVLLSAGEIPRELAAGRIHLGVTGSDLVREQLGDGRKVAEVAKLGFGHADLVIAVPTVWIDVETVDDLDAAAAGFRKVHGHRLRIATKYHRLVRDFLQTQGVADYQLVDSQGATEGTVLNGTAEAIADITSSGETLRANHLQHPVGRADPFQPGGALGQPGGELVGSGSCGVCGLAASWGFRRGLSEPLVDDFVTPRCRPRGGDEVERGASLSRQSDPDPGQRHPGPGEGRHRFAQKRPGEQGRQWRHQVEERGHPGDLSGADHREEKRDRDQRISDHQIGEGGPKLGRPVGLHPLGHNGERESEHRTNGVLDQVRRDRVMSSRRSAFHTALRR